MAQCKDGKEYLSGDRVVYDFIPVDKSTYPEAEIRAKLAKNRGWSVCKSWLDQENKQFVYECAVNAKDIAQRTVSFADACKDFHWKKFDIISNGQTVKWTTDDEFVEKETAYCNKRKYSEQPEQSKDNLKTVFRK